MNEPLSLISLLLHASLAVKGVMLILVLASIASWAIIFQKSKQLHRVKAYDQRFEEDFWSGTSLSDLQAAAAQNVRSAGPQEKVFLAGMREVQKLRERRIHDRQMVLDAAHRAMHAGTQRELDQLEEGLPLLASIGSISPYIGLFGTVWGIMSTFTTFGTATTMSLATVAPSIAEALIATAMGLLTAIPAVLAYNHYARETDRRANALEGFSNEFCNILQRQLQLPSTPHSATPPYTK